MIHICLDGPGGNAFALMATTRRIGKELGFSAEKRNRIMEAMTSGDYETLIAVMEVEFGDYIKLHRRD